MKINFSSTRLAFFLIAILLLLILLSAIIPQKDIAVGQITDLKETMSEAYKIIEVLNLDEIYTSPYFFILLGLLAVNLIFGNIKRFRIIYRTEKSLLKTKYIGSIIFHFSLILIMIGVILNYLYRFEGYYSITEGQMVSDIETDYAKIFKGPLYSDDYGQFEITLDSFYTKYKFHDDYTEAALIELNLLKNDTAKKRIIHNSNQFLWENIEFHYGTKSGYSPEVLLSDSLNNLIFKSFIRVAHQKDENHNRHFDYIYLDKYEIKIEIEVFPDKGLVDSTFFNIFVEKSDNLLYEGTIRLGEKVEFDNYSLVVPRLRQWCYINVIKNPFLTLIFFGFWSALAGLVINLIPRVITESKKK